MIELSNGSCFTLEKAKSVLEALAIRIKRCFRMADFDCYLLADTGIFGEVDFTHTPTAEQASKPILTELASFQRHSTPHLW